MRTVDQLLLALLGKFQLVKDEIPKRDSIILMSLGRQLSSELFLTKNQAALLTKILKEQAKPLSKLDTEIDEVVTANQWSSPFRDITITSFRKITLGSGLKNFTISFSYNKELFEKMDALIKQLPSAITRHMSSIKYDVVLTEESLFLAINTFIDDNFEIDAKLLEFYEEIVAIKESNQNPFDVYQLPHDHKMRSIVEEHVGKGSSETLFLHDRAMRYQYVVSDKLEAFTLTEKIATRPSRKIFLNDNLVSFNQLIKSLIELKRFPILIIFDGYDSAKDRKIVDLLSAAAETYDLGSQIGIYFRYIRTNDVAQFNQEVGRLNYNQNLTAETQIAGISNNKIPKFMIGNHWKPQAIISFTNAFKANKSYVYCSDVDLIVYYGSLQPLDEEVHAIL